MAARRKLDASFEDIVSAPPPSLPTVKPLQRHDAAPVNRDAVTTPNQDSVKALKRAHVSLYVSVKVQRAIKQLALDKNVRAHDLYLDGLRHVMQVHGLDFDKLNAS